MLTLTQRYEDQNLNYADKLRILRRINTQLIRRSLANSRSAYPFQSVVGENINGFNNKDPVLFRNQRKKQGLSYALQN